MAMGEETDENQSTQRDLEQSKQRHKSSMSVQPIELMTSNNVTTQSGNYQMPMMTERILGQKFIP